MALVEHVAAVGHLQEAAGVLLDHEDGHTGAVDGAALEEHLILQRGGEPGGRLVEQQHGGLEHQRPAHGHHLPLAARQRAGSERRPLGQPGNSLNT
ncbi:MAG: hypothetical protein R2749_04325 [Acidimicrobiales bacterium]